jgi:hypothetical protein
MKPQIVLQHEFVEFIPSSLKERTIYISMRFGTAAHLCACGCGNKVVTPLRPTDWTLIYDGKTVSLDPSIGNWSFACQSHYWIKRNNIRWGSPFSKEKIAAARASDSSAKENYFDSSADEDVPLVDMTEKHETRQSLWAAIKDWWTSRR